MDAVLGNSGWGVLLPGAEDVWLADAYETSEAALNAAKEALPFYTIGTRVRLRHDVDRYPHFIALKGMLGTVAIVQSGLIGVRLDEHLDGAEDWDNEVHWFDDGLWSITLDLEVVA